MSLLTDPRWGEALGHLPDYLGNHVRVSVTALALGLLVSLPLAIISRHRPVMRGALLGLAGEARVFRMHIDAIRAAIHL